MLISPLKDLASAKSHFPFSFAIFQDFLKQKHELILANLYRSKTSQKVGLLTSYNGQVQISTNMWIRKSGRIQETVGLELNTHSGFSYESIDAFFQPKLGQENEEDGTFSAKDSVFKQFILSFKEIVNGKFNIKLTENPYSILFIQLVELLIYQEGARHLNSIAHVIMWYALALKTEEIVSFQKLPFSLKKIMPIFRYLRPQFEFDSSNFEFFYDYALEERKKDDILTKYYDLHDTLFTEFLNAYRPKDQNLNFDNNLEYLQLHLIHFFLSPELIF